MQHVHWQPMFALRHPKDDWAYLFIGDHKHEAFPEVAVWDKHEKQWWGTLNGELYVALSDEYTSQWSFYCELGPRTPRMP